MIERLHHPMIWPLLAEWLPSAPSAVLDAGCGQGQLSARMTALGHHVTGIDFPTTDFEQGVALRRASNPRWDLIAGSVESLPLNGRARFDVVISIEVIEHLYRPLTALRNLNAVMNPGGTLILSTPYHGWLKNVAISLAADWDFHHTTLEEGGHIKFWSRRTLTLALNEAGFEPIEWRGRGRVPWLWKSIMVKARKVRRSIS